MRHVEPSRSHTPPCPSPGAASSVRLRVNSCDACRVVASVVALRLRRQLGRVIRIGREPSMLPSEARYVVLTNIVALLGATFTLGFAPILLLAGAWLYPALQVVYALVYLPPLWLNRRRHHVAATTWLVLGSHLAVVSQVPVEGRGF